MMLYATGIMKTKTKGKGIIEIDSQFVKHSQEYEYAVFKFHRLYANPSIVRKSFLDSHVQWLSGSTGDVLQRTN